MYFSKRIIYISIVIAIGKVSFAQVTKIADSMLIAGSYKAAIKEYTWIISSDTNSISVIDHGNAYLRRGPMLFIDGSGRYGYSRLFQST